MTELAPFRLEPVLVERPWGGRRLADYGKRLPEGVVIGESWELCDLPAEVAPHVDDPSSRVLDGPFAGERLRTVVAEASAALLGPVPPTADNRFPLLFKLLDAHEHLSVQVHPHEAYVATHPEARLKTESWYMVDADPGSELYLGLVEGTTLDDVAAVMGTAGIVPLLGRRLAVPGAFHHVPAGLVHALGAGALVAEVQTPSDSTFRIYDWTVEYGRAPRPLHAAEAIASIVIEPPAAFSLDAVTEPGVRELVANEHYRMREHRIATGGSAHSTGRSALSTAPGPVIICITRGSVALGALELSAGTTAIVPASSTLRTVEGSAAAVILEIGVQP